MKARMFCIVIAVVALVLAGCSGGAQPPKPTSTPVDQRYAFAPACDTSALSSYTVKYQCKWESVKSGQKETGSWEVAQAFVRQPPALHVIREVKGTGEGEYFEIVQFGDSAYSRHNFLWTLDPASASDISSLKGNRFMSDAFALVAANRGELVQKGETVNGVAADRYAFDETALGAELGLGEVTKAKGEVWVSTEHKVVVKYTAHYEGKNLAIGGGEEGVVDMSMDLTRVNKAVFKPAEIAVLDDAADFTAVGGMVCYITSKAEQDIVNFYEAAMVEKGWIVDALNSRQPPAWYLVYPTGGIAVTTLRLRPQQGKTTVIVTRSEVTRTE